MGSGGTDGGAGRGPNGGGPGPSPFGPLELPRDETEVLPRFDEYADQGPPPQQQQGYDPRQYPPNAPYDANAPHNPAGRAGAAPLGPPPNLAPPAAPSYVPPRPPHAPPGAPGAGAAQPGAPGPDPYRPSPPPAAGPADATQVFPANLFRDGPGTPPAGSAQPMPPARSAQPAGYPGPQPAGYPAPQPHTPQYAPPAGPPRGPAPGDYRDGGGRNRTPLIAAGVGALVVIAAIGVFASGAFGENDKNDKNDNADKSGASTSAPPTPSGSAAPKSAEPPAKADDSAGQASAVDRLLQISAGSRQTVSQAVQKIQRCDDPAGGAQSLGEAARQRDEQIAGLDKLKTDKLARGPELVSGLRTAWTASAESDRELAAWGTEMAQGGCADHKAENTEHKRAADRASGRATSAKSQVVAIWNPIAADNNLKKRGAGEI